jgi:hypothetical protein
MPGLLDMYALDISQSKKRTTLASASPLIAFDKRRFLYV